MAAFPKIPLTWPSILTTILLFLCWKFPLALLDSAVTGWINTQIADSLGISSPSVENVALVLWHLVAPLAGVFATLLLYHYLVRGNSPQQLSSDLGEKLSRAKARTIEAQSDRSKTDIKEERRPTYQPPLGHTYDSLSKISNFVLGEHLITVGQQIDAELKKSYRIDNLKACTDFLDGNGPLFFGFYQEARRRGYKNEMLDTYFEYPDNIQNIERLKWISQELRKFGAQVKIRA